MMSRRSTSPVHNRTTQSRKRPNETSRARKPLLRKAAQQKSSRQFAHYAPPMVMRSGRAEVPTRQVKRARTRRRYDVALGRTGAEIRLPALPAIRIGWQWVSGALVVLILTLLWTFWNSPTYQVQAASLEGAERTGENQVNQILDVQGKPVFTVNPAEMQAELAEAFPEFSNIQVSVLLPNQVYVNVIERVPVLVWVGPEGEKWVDAEGYAFPVRAQDDTLPVFQANQFPGITPVAKEEVEGEEGEEEQPAKTPAPSTQEQVLLPETVKGMLALKGSAPQDAPLTYDLKYGWGWQDPQGWQVFFGLEASDMDKRLLVYRELVAELQAMEIQPTFISVEFPDAPYFRK